MIAGELECGGRDNVQEINSALSGAVFGVALAEASEGSCLVIASFSGAGWLGKGLGGRSPLRAALADVRRVSIAATDGWSGGLGHLEGFPRVGGR